MVDAGVVAPVVSRPGGPARKDPRWSALGFQQADPATDFRGAGMVALQLMRALAREHTQVLDPLRAPARSYRVA